MRSQERLLVDVGDLVGVGLALVEQDLCLLGVPHRSAEAVMAVFGPPDQYTFRTGRLPKIFTRATGFGIAARPSTVMIGCFDPDCDFEVEPVSNMPPLREADQRSTSRSPTSADRSDSVVLSLIPPPYQWKFAVSWKSLDPILAPHLPSLGEVLHDRHHADVPRAEVGIIVGCFRELHVWVVAIAAVRGEQRRARRGAQIGDRHRGRLTLVGLPGRTSCPPTT